jgi:3-hydroxyisobutyrate dehydrogenase
MKGRGAVIARGLAGQPPGETAFGLSAAKKDLATAVQFAATIHAKLPVTASALACFEEAEAAGLGDSDATTMSVRWPQRSATKPSS